MLEISEAAIAWLVENRARNRIPSSFGVRIFEGAEGERIAVRSAAEPRPNEVTIERQGLRFFMSPEISRKLAGRHIDVGHGASGDRLLIRRRTAASNAAEPVTAAHS